MDSWPSRLRHLPDAAGTREFNAGRAARLVAVGMANLEIAIDAPKPDQCVIEPVENVRGGDQDSPFAGGYSIGRIERSAKPRLLTNQVDICTILQ